MERGLVGTGALRARMAAVTDTVIAVSEGASDGAAAADVVSAYESLRRSTGGALTQVFSDPRVGVWIARSSILVSGLPDSEIASSLLSYWHDRIQHLAAGAAVVDSRPFHLDLGVDVIQSPRLLGQGFSVSRVDWQPFRHLSFSADGRITTDALPTTRHEAPGARGIWLSFDDPDTSPPDGMESRASFGLPSERQAWSSLVRRAVDLLNKVPLAANFVRDFGSIVVPIVSARAETHCSVSFASRPGILFMSWAPKASTIAEALVHESDHQYFYMLAREGEVWANDHCAAQAVYRSPWRDDARPLDGLLRGASAFVRVAEFWAAVGNLGIAVDEPRPEWPHRRAVQAVLEAREALSIVELHGCPAALGAKIIEDLMARCNDLQERLAEHTAHPVWVIDARDRIDGHNRRWMELHGTSSAGNVQLDQ